MEILDYFDSGGIAFVNDTILSSDYQLCPTVESAEDHQFFE